MNKEELNRVNKNVIQIIKQDREFLIEKMTGSFEVQKKTSRRDLVTSLDKINQKKLKKELFEVLEASFLVEEGDTANNPGSAAGLIWVIDPIDGTLNFVKQRDNFAVMIALYEDGKPLLGYIIDVIQNILIAGGPDVGVTVNGNELQQPKNVSLANGLVGLSGPMLAHNMFNFVSIQEASLGVRVIGSAGIEFMRVLLGKQVAYVSNLHPWDFAAGRVLASALDLMTTNLDGEAPNMLKSSVVLVATKKAHADILDLMD